jgi:glycosyltransferase involved in cell wall biosynthesis
MKPLVSLIIPTHRPNNFKTALMCALSQTYDNKEIIVSDNSDTTEIKAICSRYPDIIYRKNVNGRIVSNIGQPLALAKGEYIKYLFDDDLIYPHCIDSMIGWLNQFSEENINSIGLITSSRHLLNDDSICYAEIRDPVFLNTSIVDGNQIIKKILLNQNNFIGEFSTIMFKRNLVDCENPESIFSLFGEDFCQGLIDVPLYVGLLQQASMLYIPHSLSAFRKHAEGGSNILGNPDFHHVVSDWFRLIRAVYHAGLLNREEARLAVTNYLNLANSFNDLFAEQLAPWQASAIDFIAELEK